MVYRDENLALFTRIESGFIRIIRWFPIQIPGMADIVNAAGLFENRYICVDDLVIYESIRSQTQHLFTQGSSTHDRYGPRVGKRFRDLLIPDFW